MRASLRQLQIFAAVARELSYTRAAEALHLTQPAVFTQVRTLEEQIGAALIERIGKRLYLTQAGEVVLASAREILGEIDRMEARLAEVQGLSSGSLRLAAVSTAQYDAPTLLGIFCKNHPGIEVALKVGNRGELLARFAANEDDLYILGTPPEEVEAEHFAFAQNPLVLVAPPDHPLATARAIAPEMLAEAPFVMREKGSGTRIATERFFAAQGLSPKVRLELGANAAIRQAVRAGLGIAVLSRATVEVELELGRLVALDVIGFPLKRAWHVAWPRGKRLSPAAQAFLDQLRATAGA
ncbi:DNA-binding transcriptional LysR family regulator [Rhodobacter sp. JA431]|uniref:LysR family transcriptional regulator n=1 Tax=Rhodobacter sp. JA431 TaxID=570013 RepID=UPI000BD02DFF|nr:LysR family transcriptional regulator [Rhodobacter sp. JA431]SOC03751.1 DNA-binding transcriptional LysR family regulator [Rhodobacter sp. JA431]